MSVEPNLALKRQTLLQQFAAMTAEERAKQFEHRFANLAEHLFELALLVSTMREAGDELPSMAEDLADDLSRIAALQMIPEVYTIYGKSARRSLYNAIRALPIADQERLCHGARIEVVLKQPDGSWDKQRLSPSEMSSQQLRQVFAGGHIRNEREQKNWLRARERAPSPPRSVKVGNLEIDRDRIGAKLGRHFIPLADLEAAVKALKQK